MKKQHSEAECLLENFHKEAKRRRVNIHSISLEMGVYYQTLYYAVNPFRRSRIPVGTPKFSYELGKSIERWIDNKCAKTTKTTR